MIFIKIGVLNSEDDDGGEETEDENIILYRWYVANTESVGDVFKLFSLNNLKTKFANLHAVLKISLTSSASCQRCFPRVKLINQTSFYNMQCH